MLSGISGSIVIVKDGGGNVYWPQYGVNQIINMLPGKGYQINLSQQQILTYPAN
ncbi:MAG: hypothetical protein NTW49_01790 [Bacteroidia bacterium]|nr:hypothetical protein [Bacteroidia bacterium]